jgi:hypothetical protein
VQAQQVWVQAVWVVPPGLPEELQEQMVPPQELWQA